MLRNPRTLIVANHESFLGILPLAGGRPAWGLWPIPVAWCLVSGTSLWTMEAPDFALMPLVALLAVHLALGGAARRSR
nr:hypothetical protein [Pseudomonas benzenivorans]